MPSPQATADEAATGQPLPLVVRSVSEAAAAPSPETLAAWAAELSQEDRARYAAGPPGDAHAEAARQATPAQELTLAKHGGLPAGALALWHPSGAVSAQFSERLAARVRNHVLLFRA